jgi:hypothetical protein
MGGGAVTSISRKQRMNTSTEAELVAADEIVGPMLWTRRFLQAQGYPVKGNILYHDNRSAILLENDGRQSVGKRSRHLNIRMFFVTDQVQKKHIEVEYCPTDEMTGDYMTKPLHGRKFTTFRNAIINLPMTAQMMFGVCLMGNRSCHATVGTQECVRSNKSNLSNLKFPYDQSALRYASPDAEETKKIHGEGWTLVTAKAKRRFPFPSQQSPFYRDNRFHT